MLKVVSRRALSPPTRRDLLCGGAAGLLAGCVRPWDGASDQVLGPWAPRPVPLPDDFVRGMNFAHQHARGHGYGSDAAARQLDVLAAFGVRDLALNPFAYMPTLTSNELRWGGDSTLGDDDLRRQIAQAHARGMRVLMKPHLWSGSFWTGVGNPDIAASSWKDWFTSYTRYVVHHARIAAETGCEGLCVGLEYTKATAANPGAWAEVAAAVRAEFSGNLCYAANWYAEYAEFTDWAAFDCVGIDAYFPLTGTTVDELSASWVPHLDAIAKATGGRPVVFPEAGYRALAGSTAKPWNGSGGAPDVDLQARAYEALLRATTTRPWFKGVYWWKWFTDTDGEGDAYVPAEPAQAVLRAWWT